MFHEKPKPKKNGADAKTPEAKPRYKKGGDGPPNASPKDRDDPPNRDGRGLERVEEWSISDLTMHPRQDGNFHPLSDEEMARLTDDMKRTGQRTPIEVTPDGRVIDGHQRWRAAQKLGWATVTVVVRHDLAGDEAAIERRMIEANLNRRQLDILDRVRLARRMLEIDEKKRPGGLSQCDEQDLRDRVGEALGMSGRNVQRYLNILIAPMEVQRAHSGGKLSMKLAEKVARLGEAEREQIASEIAAGGDPAEVVAVHLPEGAPSEVDPDKGYDRLLKAATRALAALDGREDEVRGGMDLNSEIETLKRLTSLVKALIARHRRRKKERAEVMRGIGELFIRDHHA